MLTVLSWLLFFVFLLLVISGKWISKYNNQYVDMLFYAPLKKYMFPPIDQSKPLSGRQRALLARAIGGTDYSTFYSLSIEGVNFYVYPDGSIESIRISDLSKKSMVSDVETIDQLMIKEARHRIATLKHLLSEDWTDEQNK